MVVCKRKILLHIGLLQMVAFLCIQASNQTLTKDPETAQSVEENTKDEYFGKHKDFINCMKWDFDSDEYFVYPNATAYVKPYNKSYTKEWYILVGDKLRICVPNDELPSDSPKRILDDPFIQFTAFIGIVVSLVCLLIHLFVFFLVAEKPNIPDYNMASMCASLFFSYLLMFVILADDVNQNTVACTVAGGMLQFSMMSTFLWMFVIGLDVFKSVRKATSNLRAVTTDFRMKNFLYNALMTWGVASLLTAGAMVVENVDGVHEVFQPQFEVLCWFNQHLSQWIFFNGPATVVVGANFLLYGISSYMIFANKLQSGAERLQSRMRRNHVMYIRLAIIMGVTWIVNFVIPMTHAPWVVYLIPATNAFQGLFILAAFTCTDSKRKCLKRKFCGERCTG